MAENIRSEGAPAVGKTAPKRRISPIWIIPIVALAIAGYLGFVTLSEQGPTITITFVTAEGLEAGKTKIRYKDVEIGVVSEVSVSEDLSKVIVKADMDKDVTPFLNDKTQFWIVKPRVGVGGVSGLGTLLSGSYITMQYEGEAAATKNFVGLEVPPAISSDVPGTKYQITSDTLGQISRGTPIYFNNLEVGLVIDYKFNIESRDFTISIFIGKPYDSLVVEDSSFWNMGGIHLETSAAGISLDLPPMEALLRGGIAFDSPDNGANIATADSRFTLYANKDVIAETRLTRNIPIQAEFGGTVRGLKVGAPVEWQGIRVGSVRKIWIVDDPSRDVSVGVIMDLQPERTRAGGELMTDEEIYESINNLIERGLRAQLKTANILTGELFVDFNFQTGLKEAALDMSKTPPAAPTVPTELDYLRNSLTEMIAKFQAIPIDEIAQNLNNTLAALEAATTAPEVQEGLKNLSSASGDLASLVASLNADATPILNSLKSASEDLSRAVDAAESAMISADSLLASDSTLRVQLEKATNELTRAARSVRIFADTLERDPSALIRGKR